MGSDGGVRPAIRLVARRTLAQPQHQQAGFLSLVGLVGDDDPPVLEGERAADEGAAVAGGKLRRAAHPGPRRGRAAARPEPITAITVSVGVLVGAIVIESGRPPGERAHHPAAECGLPDSVAVPPL